MVPDCSGRQLYAVADKIILIRCNGKRINLSALCRKKCIQTSGGHGERIVAELELAALLADFIHREVHDPAEGILLLVHVAGNCCSERLDENTCRLLGSGLLTGSNTDKITGLQAKRLHKLVLQRRCKLGNTADKLTVLIHTEPVRLASRLDLYIRKRLVNKLTGSFKAGNHNGLDDHLGFLGADHLTVLILLLNGRSKRSEAAVRKNRRNILNRQINTKIRLV